MAQNAPERLKAVQISGKNVDMNIMHKGITESGNVNKLLRASMRGWTRRDLCRQVG